MHTHTIWSISTPPFLSSDVSLKPKAMLYPSHLTLSPSRYLTCLPTIFTYISFFLSVTSRPFDFSWPTRVDDWCVCFGLDGFFFFLSYTCGMEAGILGWTGGGGVRSCDMVGTCGNYYPLFPRGGGRLGLSSPDYYVFCFFSESGSFEDSPQADYHTHGLPVSHA